jgi:LCP family protein required for cell wall assembly
LKSYWQQTAGSKSNLPGNRPPKKRFFSPGKAIFVVLFLLIVALSSFIGFFLPVMSKLALLEVFLTLTPSQPLLSESNILILGVDQELGISRSDTIMVLHYDPINKSACVISIPRDTIVVIPGRGLDKINHAFAYGGPDLSRRTVETFLGVSIPNYITVDVHGLAKIIDDLGGITVNVEKRMYYVDYAGDLHINLWPGIQRLGGRDAVAYVRFRHDNEGDFGRIRRQQQFLQAIAAELMSRKNVFKSPQLFFELLTKVTTNLNSRQILGLALGIRSAVELNNIQMTQIPGDDMLVDGIYYYKPNRAAVENIARKYLKKTTSNAGSNVECQELAQSNL